MLDISIQGTHAKIGCSINQSCDVNGAVIALDQSRDDNRAVIAIDDSHGSD